MPVVVQKPQQVQAVAVQPVTVQTQAQAVMPVQVSQEVPVTIP